MYLEYFSIARDHLKLHGLNARVVMGSPVLESDLKVLDRDMGIPMPPELRQFYLELGDGFAFIPDDSDKSKLRGWPYMHLADHRICNKDFRQEVEEQALAEIGQPAPRTDPVLLRKEMESRKSWMPFYGFGGGGDYLCLDLGNTPPPVRFFESVFWVATSPTWDFVIASSLTEFVEKWSRYHFLSPVGNWVSFCGWQKGSFDWSPERFPRIRKGVGS